MPELLWKAYIDFEFEEGERERTRALYERLLEKSKHLKIWLAYARFEMAKLGGAEEEEEEEADEESAGDPARARAVYDRAYRHFKAECNRPDLKDDIEELRKVKAQRAELVLNAWKPFEDENGSADDIGRVNRINPHKELVWEPSDMGGMEEVWAWKFDDDIQEENPNAFKFLQMARAWKASAHKNDTKDAMDEDDSDEDDSDGSEDGGAGPSKVSAGSDEDESD
ncbi:NineTeen Complex (NTC) component [Tulasnella sp. 427]|nr:NineTeen Complex (NTC) component [Tulasnella sp. 427]